MKKIGNKFVIIPVLMVMVMSTGMWAMDDEGKQRPYGSRDLTPAERRALYTPEYRAELDQGLFTTNDLFVWKIMLELGADINAKNEENKSLLEIAISNGDIKRARFLHNQGAYVNGISLRYIGDTQYLVTGGYVFKSKQRNQHA